MIAQSFSRWMTTLRQPGVWTGAVWSILFLLLMVALLLAAGQSALLSRSLHPTSLATPAPATNPGISFLVMYVILIGVGPFWTAGLYGLYGAAIKGESVGFGTFWQMGRKLYGRGWGLVLYAMIYGAVLGLVAVILIAGLKVLWGGILVGVLVVLSLPWATRMSGGLFVDAKKWGASFKGSFRGGHFWAFLGGILVAVLGYLILYGLFVLLGRVSVVLALILYLVFALAMSVAAPLWAFALYDVEARG